LEKVLAICPSRHVACHHIALSYKCIWLADDRHQETLLFNNPAKQGKKKSVMRLQTEAGGRGSSQAGVVNSSVDNTTSTKQQPFNKKKTRCKHGSWNHPTVPETGGGGSSEAGPLNSSASTTNTQQTMKSVMRLQTESGRGRSSSQASPVNSSADKTTNTQETKKSVILLHTETGGGGTSQAGPVNSCTDNTTNTQQQPFNKKKKCRKHAPPNQPTVPSRTRELGHVQEQKRKQPDFFDKLRVNNPKCKNSTYLDIAIGHLQNAVKFSPTSSRYHIDLGRLYISRGRIEDARSCFKKAANPENFIDDNDAAYLYEQWGLLEEQMHAKIDNVKELYRMAILFAVKVKVRSKMAFYNLRDILFLQKEEGQVDRKIMLELELLYKTMEQYEKSKQCLLEALQNDEENVELTWRLIRTMHLEKTVADAKNSFRYLNILAASSKLDLKDVTSVDPKEVSSDDEANDDEDDSIPSRRRVILDIMKLVIKNKETKAAKLVFDWLIGSTATKVDGGAEKVEKSDVCVLMSTSMRTSTEYARHIVNILKDVGNLIVESSDDIGYEKNPRTEMNNMIHRSKAVIVVVDQGGESWEDILLIVEETLIHSQFNVCLACDNDSDFQESQPSRDNHFRHKWPRFTFDDKLSDETIIYELFRLMLDTSPSASDI